MRFRGETLQNGEQTERIYAFTGALERELSGYTFNSMVTAEAFVRWAGVGPDFPKLYVRLTWDIPDRTHHFEASISLDELKPLSEETEVEQQVYFYHLARMMLSSLALGRVIDAAEETEEVEL